MEPDVDTRALYRDLFARTLYTLHEAADEPSALDVLRRQRVALAIVELRLPGHDGVRLCERVRRDPATARIPILVVTSEARPSELERTRRAGADIILTKPASVDALLRESTRLIRESEVTRKNDRWRPENGERRRGRAPEEIRAWLAGVRREWEQLPKR